MITLEKATTGFSGLESPTQSKGTFTRLTQGRKGWGDEAGAGGLLAELSEPAPVPGSRRAGRWARPSRGLLCESRQRLWSWDHPAELAEFGQRRWSLVPLRGPVTASGKQGRSFGYGRACGHRAVSEEGHC